MENSRLHHQVSLATRKKMKKLCCSNTQISGDWCRLLCPKLNSWFPLAALAALAATTLWLENSHFCPIYIPLHTPRIPLQDAFGFPNFYHDLSRQQLLLCLALRQSTSGGTPGRSHSWHLRSAGFRGHHGSEKIFNPWVENHFEGFNMV